MIQIWPLWMKIGVWWCSVTFLTTFGVLCIVRLMLFILMWILGFRGIWLFPNLFDDNQTFAGSFMPIFGKGDPIIIYEDSDEEYNEYLRKKSKKKDSKDGKGGESSDSKKVIRKKASEADEDAPKWQFGLINIFIIFGVGGLWCLQMGFFDGENVPDFVAKRDDLQYYFKGLAAPEPVNATGCAVSSRAPPAHGSLLLQPLPLHIPSLTELPPPRAVAVMAVIPSRPRTKRRRGGSERWSVHSKAACYLDVRASWLAQLSGSMAVGAALGGMNMMAVPVDRAARIDHIAARPLRPPLLIVLVPSLMAHCHAQLHHRSSVIGSGTLRWRLRLRLTELQLCARECEYCLY